MPEPDFGVRRWAEDGHNSEELMLTSVSILGVFLHCLCVRKVSQMTS